MNILLGNIIIKRTEENIILDRQIF